MAACTGRARQSDFLEYKMKNDTRVRWDMSITVNAGDTNFHNQAEAPSPHCMKRIGTGKPTIPDHMVDHVLELSENKLFFNAINTSTRFRHGLWKANRIQTVI